MTKKLVAFVMLACLVLTFTGGDADARRRNRKNKKEVGVSSVTISFTDREPAIPLPALFEDPSDFFAGTISKVRGCDGNQTVEVHRAGQGTVGTTEATSNGDWTIYVEDPGTDTYFAKVTGVTKRGRQACSRGTSALLSVEDA